MENEKKPVYQELQRTIDEDGDKSVLTQVLFNNKENLTGVQILGCDKRVIQSFDEYSLDLVETLVNEIIKNKNEILKLNKTLHQNKEQIEELNIKVIQYYKKIKIYIQK